MAPSYADVPAQSQRRRMTPAERAEDAHDVQLRLKQEASERRQQAPGARARTASAESVSRSPSASQ
jgi:hypothetical protein